jgi:hypothetical protein
MKNAGNAVIAGNAENIGLAGVAGFQALQSGDSYSD